MKLSKSTYQPLIGVFIGTVIGLSICWTYQAKFAQDSLSIDLPGWLYHETNPNCRHYVVIHKSQIHPWGTHWKETKAQWHNDGTMEMHLPVIKE